MCVRLCTRWIERVRAVFQVWRVAVDEGGEAATWERASVVVDADGAGPWTARALSAAGCEGARFAFSVR